MSPTIFASFLLLTCLGYSHAAFKTCVMEKGTCETDKYTYCVEDISNVGWYLNKVKYKVYPHSVADKPAGLAQCSGKDATDAKPNTVMCHGSNCTNKKLRVACFKTQEGTAEEKWVPVQAVTDESDRKRGFLGSSYGVLSYETHKQALATSPDCGM